MPEQFPYPETGWSTGKMRMARASGRGLDPSREYRELEGVRKEKEHRLSEAVPQEEFDSWWKGNWEVVGKGKVDPSKVDPSGFMIHKDNPQFQELQKDFDVFDVPDKGWSDRGFQFMKRRQEGVPVAGNGWEGPSEGPGPQRATG
jgi:hypothetical protein